MTYHVADMPLNVVVVLVTPREELTRVLAQRQMDRILFIVGRMPFEEPPRTALHPRSSSRVATAPQAPPSNATGAANALIGSWRTVGADLELRTNGTFSRVSHSGRGQYGGVIALDDEGRFDVQGDRIVFHGLARERTCAYSFSPQNELLLCGVAYHR
jgi:hypothetical protein